MNARARLARPLIALPAALLLVALAACGGSSHATAKPSAHSSAKTSPTPSSPPTFSAKYASIKTGMTIGEVRTIMGAQGSVLSQADNGAGTTSIVLEWADPKAQSHQVIAAFVNNVMMSKSAIGF
jgi:hypothetical protein